MRYPIFTPNPGLMSDEARIFRPGGHVEIVRAPTPIGRERDVFGLPGPVSPATWAALPRAVEIIHRIVPWTTVTAAPILVSEVLDDGYPNLNLLNSKDSSRNPCAPFNGISFSKQRLVALSLQSRPTFLFHAAYHEAFHQVEEILHNNILDEIDRHLIPIDFGSAYENSWVERRARAFAVWCGRFEEGLPNIKLSTRLDQIFDQVATGEVAKEWITLQQKAAKRAAKYQSR